MTNTIRREVLVPQSRELVWSALTDRETLAEWMYPNDFEPVLGHKFTFHVPANPKVGFVGLVVQCEVLECEPPQQSGGGRLVFSWTAGGIVDTRVSFRLESRGNHTLIFFEHAGFDLSQPFGEQAMHGAEYGWAKMLKQLAVIVEKAAADRK